MIPEESEVNPVHSQICPLQRKKEKKRDGLGKTFLYKYMELQYIDKKQVSGAK